MVTGWKRQRVQITLEPYSETVTYRLPAEAPYNPIGEEIERLFSRRCDLAGGDCRVVELCRGGNVPVGRGLVEGGDDPIQCDDTPAALLAAIRHHHELWHRRERARARGWRP